jgi:hypothetical protein
LIIRPAPSYSVKSRHFKLHGSLKRSPAAFGILIADLK